MNYIRIGVMGQRYRKCLVNPYVVAETGNNERKQTDRTQDEAGVYQKMVAFFAGQDCIKTGVGARMKIGNKGSKNSIKQGVYLLRQGVYLQKP